MSTQAWLFDIEKRVEVAHAALHIEQMLGRLNILIGNADISDIEIIKESWELCLAVLLVSLVSYPRSATVPATAALLLHCRHRLHQGYQVN